jgi:hypothetical protein
MARSPKDKILRLELTVLEAVAVPVFPGVLVSWVGTLLCESFAGASFVFCFQQDEKQVLRANDLLHLANPLQ